MGTSIGAQGTSVNLQAASSLSGQQFNTLSQMNAKNLFNNLTTGGIFTDEPDTDFVKKYTVYDMKEDVIALAVANHRIKSFGGIYHKLTESALFTKVTSEDREEANRIREYYKKKFTYLGLTSTHRSNYREDLLNLVNNDGKKIPESYIGIAYYLPHFYAYDIKRDEVKSTVMTKGAKQKVQQLKHIINNYTLTPLQRIHRKTKRTNFYEYWFKTEDNYGFMIPVSIDNNLLGMIEYVFAQKTPIEISGKLYTKELDNFEYFTTTNWNITKI